MQIYIIHCSGVPWLCSQLKGLENLLKKIFLYYTTPVFGDGRSESFVPILGQTFG